MLTSFAERGLESMGFRAALAATMVISGICAGLAVPITVYAQTSEGTPPPLSAYGELPALEDAALSESGNLLAVIATVDGIRALIVLDSDNVLVKSIPVERLKVFGMHWAGDSHVLLRISQTEDLPPFWSADQAETSQMLIVDINSDERAQRVFENEREIADLLNGFYGLRKVDGRWKGYFGGLERSRRMDGQYVFAGRGSALYEVDIADNKARRAAVAPAAGKSRRWLVDANGDDAAILEQGYESSQWEIFNGSGKTLAKGSMDIPRVWLRSFDHTGTKLIYGMEDRATGRSRYFEVPLDGSAAPVEILQGKNIRRFFTDPVTGRMLGYLEDGSGSTPVFAEAANAQTVHDIFNAFDDATVNLVEWTPDFSNHLVRTNGSQNAGSWYHVNLEEGEARLFGTERPLIAPSQVGPVSSFSYLARDGMILDGVLTLPPHREPKNLPVIILPHGGPHAHDEVQFDWWAQAFASRGYAVLQPNFRGSTNRDEAFRRAGYGEWGAKMQTDKTDGLNALAEQGIVDPSRACIVGASYGGYAALAGVTIEQGIYRCAVAVAPVTDIQLTINTDYSESGRNSIVARVLKEQFGNDVDYDAISPRKLAYKADAPILLIHGREDTVVEYRQSKVMADELKKAGKPFKLVTLDEADHWLTRSSSRLAMLTEAVAFVKEHNPPD